MTVDFNINLGHLISLVGMLIVFITWAQNIRWSVENVNSRLSVLEKGQEEQTKLIISNAVMNTNMVTITDRLLQLERRLHDYERMKHNEVRT